MTISKSDGKVVCENLMPEKYFVLDYAIKNPCCIGSVRGFSDENGKLEFNIPEFKEEDTAICVTMIGA